MKLSVIVTLVVLSVISLSGAAYMSFGVLGIASTNKTQRMTLMLNSSGGLMNTSQVTLRGIKVGRVTDIQATPTGLAVSMNLDSTYPIPVDSAVSVQNLSAAGEQYVEFNPARIEPPYYSDGAVIPAAKVAPTYTVSELLAKGNALLSTLNPDDVNTILKNVAAGVVDNTATIDRLATTTRLFAQMVQDDKDSLTTLIGNTSRITNGLGDIDAGGILKQSSKTIPGSIEGLALMVKAIERLEPLSESAFGDNKPTSELVAKVFEYIDNLSVPLGEFVTVLEPVVAPMRELKIDAGHWLDFWDSTFNNQGGVRVHLGVPEWPQQDPAQPGPPQSRTNPGVARQASPVPPNTHTPQPTTAERPAP
ncbi:MCE family protein [Mycobacterium sp. CBMA271]|uniref:MlaD family protein n=1 Tax=unclassified Mycobacteroides TaxID=2618759 RepID=UPI0012DF11BA|nr:MULTISPECIES: MlaD family protein [unclassified Mycobacteroides]MUM19775.1 mammalian cell entry protein [Mycobacteroides sp. CBMA 326]MUM21068.1 MCE family protein [Mycobacteroides sp. CBMA 271]